MKFIIQRNLTDQVTVQAMEAALIKHHIPYDFVDIIPFTTDIIPLSEPLNGVDYLPYGSTTLTVETHARGWRGQYFTPETFRYDVYNVNRDDMLNSNIITTVRDAIHFLRNQPETNLWFVRPVDDLKKFSGQVIEAKECADWLEDAVKCDSSGSYGMELDMQIVLSEPVNIRAEYRCFIVDGKVIDISMYRHQGKLFKMHIDHDDWWSYVHAQSLADKWLPHPCCVMDLAILDGDTNDQRFKVIEFNTINSSGFYGHNIERIAAALWAYFKKTGE